MITGADPFRNVCRITRDGFAVAIAARPHNTGLETERDLGAYWDEARAWTIDPCFLLAMAIHESQLLTAGVAVTTKSWGNTRQPSFGAQPVGEVPGRTGTFPVFATYLDGCTSTVARLASTVWPTVAPYGERDSIAEVFSHPSGAVWAPAGDLNSPAGYLNSMLRLMNQYADQADEPITAAPQEPAMSLIATIGQRLSAMGVEVHDLRDQLARGGAYPRISRQAQQYTAIHYTGVVRTPGALGTDVASWKGHASYHVTTHGWPGIAYCLGVSLSGRVCLLHEVEEMGYHGYNANAVSFPVSVDMGTQAPTEAALLSLARVVDVLHNETPELANLGYVDTYGHSELGFLDRRNITPCPGNLLPYVQRYRGSGDLPYASNPTEVTFPTGVTMQTTHGFYQYWEVEGGVAEFGYPITDEMTEDGQTVQYFERARLEYAQDGSILRGLVGSEAFVGRYGPAGE